MLMKGEYVNEEYVNGGDVNEGGMLVRGGC